MLAAIDSWLFLLLLAMAAIFRLLTKAAGSKTDSSERDESTFPTPGQPSPRRESISDEEQIRKFLEALGQPRTAKPPPPVAPRTDVPPRPIAPVQPPKSMAPAPIFRRAARETQKKSQPPRRGRESAPPPLPQRYEPKRSPPIVTPAPTFEVHETTAPLPEVIPAATTQIPGTDQRQPRTVVDLIRTARGMRDAIILREILGPPRGTQPFEFSGAA